MVPDLELLFHSFVYASQDPRPVIILEDISPDGYIMFEKPMNVPQSFMVFKRLAEFHAASLYLQENVHISMSSYCSASIDN